MRRRLTLTIVAVVTGALFLTGIGTLVLARLAVQRDTERDLVRQARAIAIAADEVSKPTAIAAIRQALRLENATLARRPPRATVWVDLPAGVTSDDLLVLDREPSVAGHHGSLVYAAARVVAPRANAAVVLTRRVPTSRQGVGYFLVAAGIALAVAGFVGDRLGHRIAKPLEDAESATRQIAAGDLAARIPSTQHADDEVGSLTSSINAMAETLERAQGLERQFLLSVSHDLRTPLTSIRGFAEAIADGATDDTVRAAEVIAAEARRLERLVGDLLDLANLDARRFTFEPQPVDVAVIAADTADAFRPLLDDAGLALAVTTGEGDAPAVARADPDRLAQVIANLVENAYAFAASRIDVLVEGDEREVRIAVLDDGPGIPAEEQARVFERLYQPRRAGGVTPRRIGSGLGLAIVAELVGAMGGSVRASSATGGGSRMVVTLSSWSYSA